jgi:hypothetical protein
MLGHSIDITPHASTAPSPVEAPARWGLTTRITFRFCFVYFSLYVVCTQMLGGLLVLPVGGIPQFGQIRPMRDLTAWVASHVFGVSRPLVITGSGSGDKTFDWVQAFCFLVIAGVAAIVWSLMNSKRDNYIGLQKWFRLFLRFALGSTMVAYGTIKVIPLQMPAPGLTRLLEPFGNFSPMGVLWYSVGASRAYEMFAGCAELVAGILLFVPGLATLGALTCLLDVIQILVLNMTYDVPVKLFAVHLILMSVMLLAPEASRLANVLVLNRTANPSTQPTLLRGRRANRVVLAVQLVFGAYLVGMGTYGAAQNWKRYGGGAPTSPLYGIWNVDEMSIDGQIRSPLITDYDRWRRLVFQGPTGASFQRMDDSFASYGAKIDIEDKTVTFSKGSDKSWSARFAFQHPAPERLILDGGWDGHKVRMQLQLLDRNTFLLVNRGFHWIQEYPFNR